MKKTREINFLVVEADTGAEFSRLMTDALRSYRDNDLEIDYCRPQTGHCAYLTYYTTTETPEDTRDEYLLRGDYHQCGECPYLETTGDRRVKYLSCHRCARVRVDQLACNWYYERLKDGTLGEEVDNDPGDVE